MHRYGLAVGILFAGVAQAQYGGNWDVFSSTSNNSSSRSTTASTNSTGATTAAPRASSEAGVSTGVPAGPSSTIVAGSAVLLAVAGGIVTTVYALQARAKAKLRAAEFLRLHPPQSGTPAPQTTPTETPSPPPQSSREPSIDAMVQARAWLLANRLQLRQDLALGAGPALEDLAGIASIAPERRAHFARLLQRRRASFAVAPQLTAQQAADVMATVGELVLADPVLRDDGELALAAVTRGY